MDSKFQFFGLEIEVLQIDDSRKAPNFKIVSEPNDWSKDALRRDFTFNAMYMTPFG